MPPLNEPALAFLAWASWARRPRISDCIDVPPDFDFGGLYLLAHFPHAQVASDAEASHLVSEVIYIGMSKGLTARIQYHNKIKEYKTKFPDPNCQCLYYSHCDLGHEWTSWDLTVRSMARVKLAFVQYAERKLIWEYARTFGRLPSLNMR